MRPVLNSDLRRAVRRGVAACLALAVFAGSGGASLIGEVCTHHGVASDAAQEPAEAHVPAPASAAGHDGHEAHGAAHAAGERHPAESHDEACTCLGACQTAAASATPAGADVVRVPAPAEVRQASAAVEPIPGASQSSWFLPPSNGPPALT